MGAAIWPELYSSSSPGTLHWTTSLYCLCLAEFSAVPGAGLQCAAAAELLPWALFHSAAAHVLRSSCRSCSRALLPSESWTMAFE